MATAVVMKRIEPQPAHREAAPAAGDARRRERASLAGPGPSEPQRERIILEHLAQVHHIARRIHDRLPPQVPLDDLVHAGVIGLMDAVRKYDPSKNVQLKHYAEFRIRGAILDSLRQIDWSPRTLRRQAKRVEQAKLICRARLGRDPSEPEIAEEIGVSLQRLQRILSEARGLDLGTLHSEAVDPNEEDAIEPPTGTEEDPYQKALRAEMSGLLGKAMGELAERERDVLALYHFEELTMKQVGAILGIGESRVSQIHSAALGRLRLRLRQLTQNARATGPGPQRVAVASLRNFA
ncbi:MAG TPA: FliA/WhiG family RNA polymerase sigma factor [Candidatus Aquilonibacter sp.]|nr:FliA/WhiG family RNA polymerase sigma factor [Candidatus Aquilonibacter sp.]